MQYHKAGASSWNIGLEPSASQAHTGHSAHGKGEAPSCRADAPSQAVEALQTLHTLLVLFKRSSPARLFPECTPPQACGLPGAYLAYNEMLCVLFSEAAENVGMSSGVLMAPLACLSKDRATSGQTGDGNIKSRTEKKKLNSVFLFSWSH